MDFITPLPECAYGGRKYKHIAVVVCRLSKRKRFLALESLDVEHVTLKFLEWIWREEGYPKSIVSDRGSQFVSYFWKRLCQRIGTTPKLSSAYHPETDGQTERANGLLKIYLRAFVNFHQDDWKSEVERQIAAELACLVWKEGNNAAD
jgi:transposase InsO family protein